ncbi:hypothetical protein ABVT43_11430 [Aliikangiella sp. GXAS 311]|uniref:Uncharacterized protein n=3 Tax=Aliikangiella maris TaxID=3162458 RepID=A0ABV2BUY8_9GAMM
MHSDPDKLLKKQSRLIHSDNMKVISHTQREKDDWFINSIMIENCEVPFKYKRKKRYKTLTKGQRVNLTYYPEIEKIAGLEFEYMKVVRIKIS